MSWKDTSKKNHIGHVLQQLKIVMDWSHTAKSESIFTHNYMGEDKVGKDQLGNPV